MVAARLIVCHWADPDGIKAHPLDVGELLDNALKAPAAVVAVAFWWLATRIVAGIAPAFGQSEPVSQDLVD